MREILFKAKLKDWKTNPKRNIWVYGYYLSRAETTYCFAEDYKKYPVKTLHFIAEERMTDWGLPNDFRLYEIDPNTLCQYTGLTDKNENMVYENDIVRMFYKDGEIDIGTIRYTDACVRFQYFEVNEMIGYGIDITCDMEVVGNVFDNPELIKSEF